MRIVKMLFKIIGWSITSFFLMVAGMVIVTAISLPHQTSSPASPRPTAAVNAPTTQADATPLDPELNAKIKALQDAKLNNSNPASTYTYKGSTYSNPAIVTDISGDVSVDNVGNDFPGYVEHGITRVNPTTLGKDYDTSNAQWFK